MHILQPKHYKLKPEEVRKILSELNISISQLPKINVTDAALPEGYNEGDVVRIERKIGDETHIYYRIVI